MKKILPAMLALAATLCGCISFEYDGTCLLYTSDAADE